MEHLKLDRSKVTSLLLVLLGNIIYGLVRNGAKHSL